MPHRTPPQTWGRRAMMTIVAAALFWILAIAIGAEYDLPVRIRGLLDLIALAGFGLGLWFTYRAWSAGRDDMR